MLSNGRLLTSFETLGKVIDCELLVGKARPALMVQPSQLLQDLGMIRAVLENSLICVLGGSILYEKGST